MRTVNCSTQSCVLTAWSNLRAGDQINVYGVTFTGEIVFANKKLAGWAQISFDSNTRFVGPSTVTEVPAVWLHDVSHVRFYGGTVTNGASGGMDEGGILVYQATYLSWWDFVVHNVGGTALSIFPVSAVDDHLDFKGEVYDWGHNLNWDPHVEKGSGLHGANIGDANYGVTNSRFAIYAHDGATGAGVEWGGNDAYGSWSGNTLYAKCVNLTFVAQIQTGGNCLQVWGRSIYGNTIPYVEATSLEGAPYFSGGLYAGESLATDTVAYGRATNTNLNGHIGPTRWDTNGGTVFQDVAPTP